MRPGRLPAIAAILGVLVLAAGSAGRATGQESPAEALHLEARVSPSPAPFGEPVTFRLSLTNTGELVLSVPLAECPVRCRVDGEFSPQGECAKPARTLELDPGQSVTLGPADAPLLALDPRVYPLSPGIHRVVLAAQGLGAADAEFEVLAPEPGHGALGGRWLAASGEPVTGGVLFLSRGVPRDADAGEPRSADVARSRASAAGGFLFPDVEPGTYLLRGTTGGRVLWYPGVRNPLLAEPVRVEGGAYRAVSLETPPPEPRPLEGSVFELSPAPSAHPLAGAVVVAIPAWPGRTSAEAGPDRDGPGFPTAVTGHDGRFRLELPEGFYRLVAGKLASHRYQFWNHVAGGIRGSWIRVPEVHGGSDAAGNEAGRDNPADIRFDLEPLQDAEVAVIRGQVLGLDPLQAKPPFPLADAEVLAVPLIPAEEAAAAPHHTRTGSDGTYRLEVPADTPYWITATAPGRRTRTFPNAAGPRGASWVDVAPGRLRDGIDLLLPPAAGPDEAGTAAIQGMVVRSVPGAGLDPARCLAPAPGVRIRVVAAFPSTSVLEFWTRTDGGGRYRIDGLPAEAGGGPVYRVLAAAEEDPLSGGPAGALLRAAVASLPARPGQSASAPRLVLSGPPASEEPGSVRGWVVNGDEEPIPGARVAVYTDPENPEGPVVEAVTDEEGAFTATGLPPETEVVVAARADGYVPAYLPGVHRWRESTRATVRTEPGPGVRVVLAPAPGGSGCIQTGRVLRPVPPAGKAAPGAAMTGPDRGPVAGAFTYLEPVGEDGERPVAGGVSGPNGTLTLTGVAGGTYRMVADRPGFEPGALETPSGEELHVALEPTASSGLAEITLTPVGYVPAGSREAGEVLPVLTAMGNAPNPFRPRTAIRYRLSESGAVSAYVFDYRGRLIRTLLEDAEQPPGVRELAWDGRDEDGNRVSAGVYFYRVQAAGYSVSSKMVVLP